MFLKILELEKLLNREIQELSGGELQRFAIAMCAIQEADIYMFDEPSSYLDVRQRLRAAEVIRDLVKDTKFEFNINQNFVKVFIILFGRDILSQSTNTKFPTDFFKFTIYIKKIDRNTKI